MAERTKITHEEFYTKVETLATTWLVLGDATGSLEYIIGDTKIWVKIDKFINYEGKLNIAKIAATKILEHLYEVQDD